MALAVRNVGAQVLKCSSVQVLNGLAKALAVMSEDQRLVRPGGAIDPLGQKEQILGAVGLYFLFKRHRDDLSGLAKAIAIGRSGQALFRRRAGSCAGLAGRL